MATIYGIINNHQGWIAYDSQPGEGTTFSVYLRVSQAASVVSAGQPTELLPHGTETILLVEDEEVVVDVIVPYLRDYGYEVLVARDGQAGWELFEEQWRDIDLVIVDLWMPRVPGHVLIEQLRTLHPDVKVIISTGYDADNLTPLGTQAINAMKIRTC